LRLKLSVHGERHARTAHTHASIALVHHAQGNLPLALKHYQIAGRIRAATLAATHASAGANFYNLGTVLEAMGRHKEAVDAYVQAIAIRRATLGADRDADLLTANLQQACGFQLQMMRPPNYAGALHQYLEAFQIRVPIFGQANATVLKSYEFLGATLKRMGKLPPALERYADADNVAMRRELANLATALCAQATTAGGSTSAP
jgi:tetratricopeptide (TPR) repeat protein